MKQMLLMGIQGPISSTNIQLGRKFGPIFNQTLDYLLKRSWLQCLAKGYVYSPETNV